MSKVLATCYLFVLAFLIAVVGTMFLSLYTDIPIDNNSFFIGICLIESSLIIRRKK